MGRQLFALDTNKFIAFDFEPSEVIRASERGI